MRAAAGFGVGDGQGVNGCERARRVGLTVDPREVEPALDIAVDEIEVLRHLFEDEQVPRQEQLALKHGRRRILGLQRLGRTNQGLSAAVDSFLGEVIENSRLKPPLNGEWREACTVAHLDEVFEL